MSSVKILGDYDALLVRSGTDVNAKVIEAGRKLKFIGRAGVGVDNIDVEAATRRGIIVANAPEGNTLAATEHTMAMMLSLARNIPQANASLKKKEWKRSKFMGNELNEKTLGIVGFGRIGRELAKRAIAMDMKVVAYDPFITKERAAQLGVEMMSMADLFKIADVITVHTPLIAETKHIVNAKSIATMKDGVRIINCARGGIIDEKALYDAVKSGKVAGAALDVFETEPPTESPLLTLDNIIVTPHLGASTVEAQLERSGLGCKAVHRGTERRFRKVRGECSHGSAGPCRNPAAVYPARGEDGALRNPDCRRAPRVRGVHLRRGALRLCRSMKFVTRLALKGLLDPILQQPVNIVNAEFIAKERGICRKRDRYPGSQRVQELNHDKDQDRQGRGVGQRHGLLQGPEPDRCRRRVHDGHDPRGVCHCLPAPGQARCHRAGIDHSRQEQHQYCRACRSAGLTPATRRSWS